MHPGVAERGLLAWRLPAPCASGSVQAALELLRAPFNFHSPCPHGCALPMVRGGSEHLATVHGGAWTKAQACSCCVLHEENELLLPPFCMQIRINTILGLIVNYLVC